MCVCINSVTNVNAGIVYLSLDSTAFSSALVMTEAIAFDFKSTQATQADTTQTHGNRVQLQTLASGVFWKRVCTKLTYNLSHTRTQRHTHQRSLQYKRNGKACIERCVCDASDCEIYALDVWRKHSLVSFFPLAISATVWLDCVCVFCNTVSIVHECVFDSSFLYVDRDRCAQTISKGC